jgi:hypothetical protein
MLPVTLRRCGNGYDTITAKAAIQLASAYPRADFAAIGEHRERIVCAFQEKRQKILQLDPIGFIV